MRRWPDYACAYHLVAEALGVLAPRPRISVAEWTHRHRYVRGTAAGLWDATVAPYLEEPLAQFDAPGVSELAVVGPGRCGKTTLAENVLLKVAQTEALAVGWYANTDDVMKAYVKTVINPLLDEHGVRRATAGTADSLSFKQFAGGSTVEFLAATDAAFRNKTFSTIVADEFDGYDPALGDARGLLNLRRATAGTRGRTLFISHPDLAQGTHPSEWRRGIMAIYAESTRCTWWWPCPECGGWSSPNPGTARHMALHYPAEAPLDEVAAQTRLLCPLCGALIEDRARRTMNRAGRWIGAGEELTADGTLTGARRPNSVAGYWIVGAMSPFLLGGIGGLARARVAAERALEADEDGADSTLRQVLTKQWGLPYTRPRAAAALDAEVLAERADDRLQLGLVPVGVRFLTTAIDVQADRFEILTRGFGEAGESWVVDHRLIHEDTAADLLAWEQVLAQELSRTFALDDPEGRVMRARVVGFDSGGAPGTTVNAYEAWKRLRARRVVRHLGKISDRDVWNLLPLKGLGSTAGKRLVVDYPDSARRDRHAGASGEVPLGKFAANAYKDAVHARLLVAVPGPRYLHVPAALRGPWPQTPRPGSAPHRWFEQLTAERRDGLGRWAKVKDGAANEVWDLLVMTEVLADLVSRRLDWRAPPPWAAAWEHNPLVSRPEAPPAPFPRPSAPPPPPVYAPAAVPMRHRRVRYAGIEI